MRIQIVEVAMDAYNKVLKKYKSRFKLGIFTLVGAVVSFGLTIGFMYLPIEGLQKPFWSNIHTWGIGFALVLTVGGAILLAHSYYSLRNIERTVDRLNPDEREIAIQEKTRSRTMRIYVWVIYPILFATSSVLVWLGLITYIGWIIIVVNILALLITGAIIKKIEYKRN